MSKLALKTDGGTEVLVTRCFAAPPEAVYRAHTDPKLIEKWLLGPEGWAMPVCINEARPGGKIRYEWRNGKGDGFYLTGEFLELIPIAKSFTWSGCFCRSARLITTSKRDLTSTVQGTLLTMRMTLPDANTRAAMLATGVERGMEASYARLEEMI